MTAQTSKSNTPKSLKFKLNAILAEMPADQRHTALHKIKNRGITYATLNRIRTTRQDDNYSPTVDNLQVIADVLNIKIDKLLNTL
ncbi:MAG: hypothetical protein R2831_10970 [Chitinophagaceae bacterium]